MRVTRHPYAVEGWGVGELWVGDGRVVVAHDPPSPSAAPALGDTTSVRPPRGTPGAPTDTLAGDRHETVTASSRMCCKGSTATSPASRLVRGRGARPGGHHALPARRRRGAAQRAVGRGRHLRRAGRARRAIRARPGRPARSARTTASRSSSRAIASSAPAGSAATARSASTTSAGSSGSRPCRSLTTCAPSSPRSRRRAAAAGWPRSPRSSTRRGASTCTGAARSRSTSTSRTSAVARRTFTLLRELGIQSEIRTYRRRAFDRATRYQLHVSGDPPALATLAEAGVLDARHAPARAAAQARRRTLVLPRRLPARRPARRRLAVRAAVSASRAAQRLARGRGVPSLGRGGRGRSARRPRPRPPRRRVREGSGRDRADPRGRRRGRRGARARGAGDRRGGAGGGEPARKRRSRESRAHEPGGPAAARGHPCAHRRRHARATPGPPAGGRPAAPAASDVVAPRAGRAVRPAGDEGLGPPPPAEARGARPRRAALHAGERRVWRAGRGSSEDDLPLRGTALRCRRQTGSESAAGRARPALTI